MEGIGSREHDRQFMDRGIQNIPQVNKPCPLFQSIKTNNKTPVISASNVYS